MNKKHSQKIESPKILCSSVIRSAHKGESHGGVYFVDLNNSESKQMIDWNSTNIGWEGRGLDRGLRGIAFYKEKIYLAASDEIFVYDKKFNMLKSFRNAFLRHCHEISISRNILYLSSTGFNSILEFDLENEKFVKGYHISYNKFVLKGLKYSYNKYFESVSKFFHWINPHVTIFDPMSDSGPKEKDILHINNVFVQDDRVYFSGTKLNGLYYINNNKVSMSTEIPFGTHNVSMFKDGVIYNNTNDGKIIYSDFYGTQKQTFSIVHYKEKDLINNHLSKDYARQGFGRGLTFIDDMIIGGSSPATISVYKLGKKKPIKTINLTMDVRNSIHGLEIWPYD